MSAESASAIHRNQVDLLDFVDWSSVECLNQKNSHSLPNALKQGYREDEGLILESDADEQLLIYIPFNQVVKLHSIVIQGPEEEGPKSVKLFANREHMGFSNVNDFPPSDTVILSTENLKGKPVIVKYVKFQNVRSLTIFIEDNQSGSDITKVQKIVLYGTTIWGQLASSETMVASQDPELGPNRSYTATLLVECGLLGKAVDHE
ncbi:UNVERIFIED_CONTAM: PITH domain-containing protein [Sesamum latifolium]|uniref:PITH domain-containing protein n=1 Tax=Sesamum latifolium TaxID=2727402 RepID=A0AAW2YEY6_9LAMI